MMAFETEKTKIGHGLMKQSRTVAGEMYKLTVVNF